MTVKLKPGDRVKLTREGQTILVDRYKRLKPTQITGTVTGLHPRLSHCVMVRLRGGKRSRGFDADYWRKRRGHG